MQLMSVSVMVGEISVITVIIETVTNIYLKNLKLDILKTLH